jgi:hypothetical protein
MTRDVALAAQAAQMAGFDYVDHLPRRAKAMRPAT